MPCPRAFAAALHETITTEDGVEMYTWRAVRRQQLGKMRKQIRSVVICMAWIEILRVGPADMVYGGKHGTHERGPEDYGIAYSAGYILAWLFTCVFAMLWVPFFSWWVPSSSADDGSEQSKSRFLVYCEKFNAIAFPVATAVALLGYVIHTTHTFIYVEGRPVDDTVKSPHKLNTRKNWGIRALLFAGVCTSLAVGFMFVNFLEAFDLAHVKTLEYYVIVLPIQVNLGVLLGSAIQFKAEQRQIRKMAAGKKTDAEIGAADEKQVLLIDA